MIDATVYIPTHSDTDAAIRSIQSCEDWPAVVVADNATSPEKRSRFLEQRCAYQGHETNLGRVGNFRWCVDHFLKGTNEWFKFLGAGDRHRPESLSLFEQAVKLDQATNEGRAKIIVGQVLHKAKVYDGLWAPRARENIDHLPAWQAMQEIALNGNIFHSMGACLIHHSVLAEGKCAAESVLSYCHDLAFMVECLRKFGEQDVVAYIPHITLDFHLEHRQTLAAQIGSPGAILEEGLVRTRAAEYFATMSGDPVTASRIKTAVKNWAKQELG